MGGSHVRYLLQGRVIPEISLRATFFFFLACRTQLATDLVNHQQEIFDFITVRPI